MNFYIVVKNRVARALSDGGRQPLLVCGNADNHLIFDFDAEWAENAVKTARFLYREAAGRGPLVYVDVPFVGCSVTAPILQNVSELWVGVLSETGISTSAARISVLSSISDFSAIESGEAESISVALDLENGDQVVTSATGRALRTVTIRKPDALIPENIRDGVTIAGVTGTYSPQSADLTPPVIALDGTTLVITPTSELVEAYDLLRSDDGEGYYLKDTFSASLDVMRLDVSDYLSPGPNYFKVRVSNADPGYLSSYSNVVTYTVDEGVARPRLSLDGTTLVVTDLTGNVTHYGLFRSEDPYVNFTSVGSYDSEGAETRIDLTPYLKFGENHFLVYAYEGDGEGVASASIPCSVTSGLTAPVIELDGTTLVITSTSTLATEYGILWGFEDQGYWLKETVPADEPVLRVDISEYLETGENYFRVRVENGDYDALSSYSNVVCYPPEPLSAPAATLDGGVMTITPGAGIATHFKILRSAYSEAYDEIVVTVEANGSEAVTVDLCPYAIYDPTYFMVRAENEYTGERTELLQVFSMKPVYSLTVENATGTIGAYYYALNMSEADFRAGNYTGRINPGKTIEGLTSDDLLYIRFQSGSFVFREVTGIENCTVTLEDDGLFIKVTDVTANATLTVSGGSAA